MNYFGVSRTARLTRIIVAFVLVVLALVVVAGLTATGARHTDLGVGMFDCGWYGILRAAGLLFFAFAGYARIATMGEEVGDPAARPRAGPARRIHCSSGRCRGGQRRDLGGGGRSRRCRCWALGCIVLVATLPLVSIGVGICVLVVGVVGRLLVLRRRRARA